MHAAARHGAQDLQRDMLDRLAMAGVTIAARAVSARPAG